VLFLVPFVHLQANERSAWNEQRNNSPLIQFSRSNWCWICVFLLSFNLNHASFHCVAFKLKKKKGNREHNQPYLLLSVIWWWSENEREKEERKRNGNERMKHAFLFTSLFHLSLHFIPPPTKGMNWIKGEYRSSLWVLLSPNSTVSHLGR